MIQQWKCVKHLHISTQMRPKHNTEKCTVIYVVRSISSQKYTEYISCVYTVFGDAHTYCTNRKKCMEAININQDSRCLLGRERWSVDTQVSLHCSLYILFMFNIASSKDYGHCKLLSPQVDLRMILQNNHSV